MTWDKHKNQNKIQPEKPAKFYDDHIGAGELLEPEESNWGTVYKYTLEFLPPPKDNPYILDVGCGTGMFAKLLYKKGYKNYLGFDFSQKRVNIAQSVVPSFQFVKRNMFSDLSELYVLYGSIICLEVLEHITEDLKFIKSLPKDKNIIFSVPNYISQTHVRAFYDKEAVIKRYEKYLNFLDLRTFIGKKKGTHINANGISTNNMEVKIFVFKCVRKG